jgi:phage baseplate assembly protein W
MSDTQARLGSDLRLLVDLERASERSGGSDLMRISAVGGSDLTTVGDVANMQQALLLRFLTRQGDLTPLGHPDYGSRLYTLIGELNNATNRNRAKLFVLEALGAEPRVQSVASVTITAGARDRIDIAVSLTVIDSDTPLNLVFPFFLGGSG